MSENHAGILNHLAANPQHGTATCCRGTLREIMMQTGGQLMAAGHLWDIRSKSLGGGVYRLSLHPWRQEANKR